MDKVLLTGAAALFLAFPVSSAAQDQMVVRGDETAVQAWVSDVGDQLDRRLASAPARIGTASPNGAAQIRFRRGVDGRPTDVRLINRKGNGFFRAYAVHTVNRLQNLPALPPTHAASTEIIANIVVADSASHRERLEEMIAGWEERRIASGPAERTVLAVASGSTAYRPN